MNLLKKILRNKLIIFILDIILLIVAVKYCREIYKFEFQKAMFTKQLEKFSKDNENPIFKIDKVILYRSANAVDNSNGNLENISISQFTDIAIYINNKNKSQEITAENTVNEVFIDNIKFTMNTINGGYILNYKNPKEFGKYSSLQNSNDRILMNVIATNEEMNFADYNNSIFYTDCSNPLTLGFINKDFITNGKFVDSSGQLLFDGSILRSANVNLKDISGKIDFMIHIKNNLGENFICNLSIDNDLTKDEELLNGYSLKINDLNGREYSFLKVSEN